MIDFFNPIMETVFRDHADPLFKQLKYMVALISGGRYLAGLWGVIINKKEPFFILESMRLL